MGEQKYDIGAYQTVWTTTETIKDINGEEWIRPKRTILKPITCTSAVLIILIYLSCPIMLYIAGK